MHAAGTAPGITHYGEANGTPGVTGSATRSAGAAPRTAVPRSTSSGPGWTITSVAHSPATTPSTSFTQGDAADTYTLTVTNSGRAATDGSTPVTLTDVVDPNISMVSMAGSGWTCDTSNDPTEVCTETGGPGGKPAVLRPGQSYPPITLTAQVPRLAGFGTQDSTAGLHVTNAVTVTGGAASVPSASIASETPIAGRPDLTADNAVDGAFRQAGTGQYQITVINQGAGPTNGGSATPITATVTSQPAGETIQALYGSGWTCHLNAITAPRAEPANTCYRTDVLSGENGEEPPITVVASVASNAPASGNETVRVSGGGDAAPAASVSAATTIQQAADLNVASTHSGSFAQGDKAGTYTVTVANVKGPNSSAGGPALGLVSVADRLPWGLTATAISGTGWTCDVAAVTCYRSDSLAVGSTYPPIMLTVSVAADAPASVTNLVTVSGGGMTSGPQSSTAGGGQTATDPTTITQTGPAGTPPPPPLAPVLTAASTHSGSFAQGDAADSYTLTVSNATHAGPASGMVTVTDTLPAGLTPTQISGRGWTCALAPPVLPGSPNTFEPLPSCYRFGSLAPGASYPPITLKAAVANDARPSLRNTVVVSGGGAAQSATGMDDTRVGQMPGLTVTSFPSANGMPYAPFAQGDGAARRASLDTANHYDVVSNGGEQVDPTYIAATAGG